MFAFYEESKQERNDILKSYSNISREKVATMSSTKPFDLQNAHVIKKKSTESSDKRSIQTIRTPLIELTIDSHTDDQINDIATDSQYKSPTKRKKALSSSPTRSNYRIR